MARDVPLARVLDRFADRVAVDPDVTDMPCVTVGPQDLVELCLFLRDEEGLAFDFLADICGVDFFPEQPRYQVVYHLYSIPHKWRLRIKCRLDDPPEVPTITPVWTTANWHEREVYDMYGIVFTDHPDLRRIYMWEEFEGFPMRRDFPLRGYKDDYNPLGPEKPADGGAT